MSERTLCILAVHFHNQTEVERYVDHVLSLPVPEGWRTVVSIADNSRNWLPRRTMDERCLVTVPESNLGYLNGCARALTAWIELERTAPDWVGVTNTDLTFREDALVELLQADWPDTVGAIAPRIGTRRHRDQNPFMRVRPSRTRLRFLSAAFSEGFWRSPLMWLLRSPAYTAWTRLKFRMRLSATGSPVLYDTEEKPESIYAPHGAAVFLSAAFFGSGCKLSMPWMMFGEELHLAEQMRKVGLSVFWVPGIRVDHSTATTTGTIRHQQLMDWRAESLRHIIDLYFVDAPSQSSSGAA